MRRNPIYVFENLVAKGINNVPIGSIVQIVDSDGVGTPKLLQLLSNAGLDMNSTIGDFLSLPNNSVELDKDTLSELEKVGNGWRLLGKDPANYSTLGNNAVDLSNSQLVGNFGAAGVTSFAIGTGTKAVNENSVVMGSYNVGVKSDTIVEIGNGISTAPANALEIYKNGAIYAFMDDTLINADPKTLTTQGFVENRVSAEFGTRTTNDLIEGTGAVSPAVDNLYYTEARATQNYTNNLALTGMNNLNDVDLSVAPIDGNILKFASGRWAPADDLVGVTSINGDVGDTVGAVVLDTDDITEAAGGNIYYTEGRFDTSFGGKTTDDLMEGVSNLYYDGALATAAAKAEIILTPLSTLSDVSTAVGNENDVLTMVGSAWTPKVVNTGVMTVNSIDGYNGGMLNGEVILGLNNIDDVVTSGASDGDMIRFDSGTNKWILTSAGTSAVISVNAKTGTVVLGTDDIVEGATNKYYNDTLVDTKLGISSIGVLGDVDLTIAPLSGDTLSYDGISWIAAVSTIGLNGLTDVDFTAPLTGDEILKYNSSTLKWEPGTDVSVTVIDDLTTGGATDALSADQGVNLKVEVGDTSTLTTTATDLSAAINELQPLVATNVTNIGDTTTLTTTANASAVVAINELDAEIGDTALFAGDVSTAISTLLASTAVTVTDSVAVDTAAMVVDFNALLAILRTADIIA